MVFLSHPYRDDNKDVVDKRVRIAEEVMAAYLNQGVAVEAWIVTTHAMIQRGLLVDAYDHWEDMLESRIQEADEMHVLQLPGWDTSEGVAGEIDLAERYDVPVTYLSRDDIAKMADTAKMVWPNQL